MGQAIDDVIMPTLLQGHGGVHTDLVNVSAANFWLLLDGEHVPSIQVLSSLSKAVRTTGESLVSNSKAIEQLKSAPQSGKGGYKSSHF